MDYRRQQTSEVSNPKDELQLPERSQSIPDSIQFNFILSQD